MVTGSLANMERTRMNAPIPKDGDRSRDKQAVYATALSLLVLSGRVVAWTGCVAPGRKKEPRGPRPIRAPYM
jgi:hypothetical protein